MGRNEENCYLLEEFWEQVFKWNDEWSGCLKSLRVCNERKKWKKITITLICL